jgi:CheY-like chemotaxis protein
MVSDAALLVVDDNVDNCELLTRLLTREGYVNVVAANDGHEALDLLRYLGTLYTSSTVP